MAEAVSAHLSIGGRVKAESPARPAPAGGSLHAQISPAPATERSTLAGRSWVVKRKQATAGGRDCCARCRDWFPRSRGNLDPEFDNPRVPGAVVNRLGERAADRACRRLDTDEEVLEVESGAIQMLITPAVGDDNP